MALKVEEDEVWCRHPQRTAAVILNYRRHPQRTTAVILNSIEDPYTSGSLTVASDV